MNASQPDPEVPVYARWPFEIRAAEGVHVTDAGGRRYLDLYGGHATASLGYADAGWLKALLAQARELSFQTNAAPVAIRARAHRALVEAAPDGLTRAFLVNSGAEANENALRVAIRATGRERIIAVEGAFHGRTAAAGACTQGSERWYGFPRAPFDVAFVPFGDVEALEDAVDDRTAALIYEPVQGVAGARELPLCWQRRAREVTARHGAVLIADEVQCGMGRVGHLYAVERAGITPDLLTLGKGLAGGFPAGAVLMNEDLAAGLGPGDLGTTFGGGPMACALVVEVVSRLRRSGFLESVREVAGALRAIAAGSELCDGVQGAGLLVGMRTRPLAKEVLAGLREHGILAGGAADPRVVRFTPPLVLKTADLAPLAVALAEISACNAS